MDRAPNQGAITIVSLRDGSECRGSGLARAAHFRSILPAGRTWDGVHGVPHGALLAGRRSEPTPLLDDFDVLAGLGLAVRIQAVQQLQLLFLELLDRHVL